MFVLYRQGLGLDPWPRPDELIPTLLGWAAASSKKDGVKGETLLAGMEDLLGLKVNPIRKGGAIATGDNALPAPIDNAQVTREWLAERERLRAEQAD